LVHGRVVDHLGRSVADAEVSFGHVEVPRGREGPEGHDFDVLTAKTDAEGRWEIRRIAPEMVRYLCGRAAHPEYSMSEQFFASGDPDAVSRLLDGTFVFRLGEGAIFRGEVTDADGQPVAEASVLVGSRGEVHSRETLSDSNGAFMLTGCAPGKTLVTVVADGFPALAVAADLSPDTPPMRLILGPGRTLRLRVVDGAGQPLAGASVGLALRDVNPQVSFSARTDHEGRLVWEHAPDQELLFEIWAPKCVGSQEVTVRPDDLEHVITVTLPRGRMRLVVTGTVSDADTGEPLPRFRMGVGRVTGELNGAESPAWGVFDRDWPSFAGGAFRYVCGPDSWAAGSICLFRFEAENYAPQVMRAQCPEDGEVRLDVQLHRAAGVLIVVYTPEGGMAAGADIGLLAQGSGLQLAPGKLAAGPGVGASITSGWLRRADAQGDAVRRIAVAHPKGYAEIEAEELRKARAIRLAPWGVIEGCWRVGGQPVVNGQIHLQSSVSPQTGQRLSESLEVAFHNFRTRTDAKGSFRFSMAPLGSVELHVWPPDLNQSVRAAVLEVLPGEANRVFVGDPEAPPGE
jgi:protocatechuate 3,4-dioxygenase beta subunit